MHNRGLPPPPRTLRLCGKFPIVILLRTLYLSCSSLSHARPLFSIVCPLFDKKPSVPLPLGSPTVNVLPLSCLYSMVPHGESFFAGTSNRPEAISFHGTEPIRYSRRGAGRSRNEISRAASARPTAPRPATRAGIGAARSPQAEALFLASEAYFSTSQGHLRRMEQRQSSPHGRRTRLLHDFFPCAPSRHLHC